MKKLLPAFMAASLLGGAVSLLSVNSAYAQAGTGEMRGKVRDSKTGEAVVGATVVATSAALQGEQVVITEDGGAYYLTALPPGTYTLTIYYNEVTFAQSNILIQAGKNIVVNVPIATDSGKGEVVVIKGTNPLIDQGSTKLGVTFNKEYTNNIPTGRTFGALLGTLPGSQGDTYGTSISGATSAENVFIVDGLNTTDTGFGTQSTNLPNEFVGETEVITGGYNAEYGRATGGIISVTTKQGSDEFHGTVFGTMNLKALTGNADKTLREGAAIDSDTNQDYRFDVGGEIGGPIIKKKLWFHVGFNPSFSKSTTTRTIASSVDKDGDQIADINPETGFSVREEIARRNYKTAGRTAFYTAKINGAINENNQFQVSVFGNPSSTKGLFAVNRNPNTATNINETGAYDVSAKYTSKINGGKTQIDLVGGFHRGFSRAKPLNAAQDVPLLRYEYERSLFDFADLEGASIAACDDTNPNDKYKDFVNCPVTSYSSQGLGFLESRTNDRTTAVLALTQRVKALGTHVFKIGADIELSTYDSGRKYSGGAFIERDEDGDDGESGSFKIRQYLEFSPGGNVNCGADADGDGQGDLKCNVTGGLQANTKNRGLGAYIQDSWQVHPSLTLNGGLRWEQQTGYVAEFLQGTITPDTGEKVPEVAYQLNNLLAPRLGFIFDPTQDGRAKIFGHFGRFYESVPLDINVRAFGGETTSESTVGADADGTLDDSCKFDHGAGVDVASAVRACTPGVVEQLGGSIAYFAPGTKGQYSQEFIAGAEYQLLPQFKIGINYINRTLPVIIEDMSTDGAQNYFIGNPGEDYTSAAVDLERQAAAIMLSGDEAAMEKQMALKDLYLSRASQLRATKTFDKPSRNYNAVEITATQRPTSKSLLIASYTYARSKGNYPGLFSTETGQLDPNLTSMYDLPDLMANRYGSSGLDRPHLVKLDGFYQFGPVLVGASFRQQSGLPRNSLVAHPLYGQGESFLLKRGSGARGSSTYQLDAKVSYSLALGGGRKLEAYFDLFNMFNSQNESDADDIYSVESAFPIIGGDANDILHAKRANRGSGRNTPDVILVNKNYGKTTARQAPVAGRLGIRFTF